VMGQFHMAINEKDIQWDAEPQIDAANIQWDEEPVKKPVTSMAERFALNNLAHQFPKDQTIHHLLYRHTMPFYFSLKSLSKLH